MAEFAVVVVLVALALGANSSIIPWPGTVVVGNLPAAITVAQSPVPVVAAPGSVAIQAAVPSPVQIVSGPAVLAAPAVVAAPTGTYVAKTRGAVHVAPLPGHVQSAVSANLEPAPGTL